MNPEYKRAKKVSQIASTLKKFVNFQKYQLDTSSSVNLANSYESLSDESLNIPHYISSQLNDPDYRIDRLIEAFDYIVHLEMRIKYLSDLANVKNLNCYKFFINFWKKNYKSNLQKLERSLSEKSPKKNWTILTRSASVKHVSNEKQVNVPSTRQKLKRRICQRSPEKSPNPQLSSEAKVVDGSTIMVESDDTTEDASSVDKTINDESFHIGNEKIKISTPNKISLSPLKRTMSANVESNYLDELKRMSESPILPHRSTNIDTQFSFPLASATSLTSRRKSMTLNRSISEIETTPKKQKTRLSQLDVENANKRIRVSPDRIVKPTRTMALRDITNLPPPTTTNTIVNMISQREKRESLDEFFMSPKVQNNRALRTTSTEAPAAINKNAKRARPDIMSSPSVKRNSLGTWVHYEDPIGETQHIADDAISVQQNTHDLRYRTSSESMVNKENENHVEPPKRIVLSKFSLKKKTNQTEDASTVTMSEKKSKAVSFLDSCHFEMPETETTESTKLTTKTATATTTPATFNSLEPASVSTEVIELSSETIDQSKSIVVDSIDSASMGNMTFFNDEDLISNINLDNLISFDLTPNINEQLIQEHRIHSEIVQVCAQNGLNVEANSENRMLVKYS